MPTATPQPPTDAGATKHQRFLLLLAATVYGIWWFVVRALLPGSFNPWGGRLAVCALFILVWTLSFRVESLRRRLELCYGLCACALMAHYDYLFVHNSGDQNWVAGSYITVLAVGVTIESWPMLLLFALVVIAGTWTAEADDPADLVALPGTVTVLILLILVGLLRQKSERERRARLDAEAERAVSEATSRMRLQFLANVSHELRTPLTSITGFSDLLADAPELSADSREILARVRANAQSLSAIVVQILTLTESDLAPLSLQADAFSVRAELEAIVRQHEEATALRGLRVSIECVEPFADRVVADQKQWRRIVDAVLTNAVKFTAKGAIAIVARRSPRRLVVDVADTGGGIAPEDRERCFAAFSQLRDDYSRPYGGAGLGLTVARRLARGMGGDVSIVAGGIGEGTTVRVEIEVRDCP